MFYPQLDNRGQRKLINSGPQLSVTNTRPLGSDPSHSATFGTADRSAGDNGENWRGSTATLIKTATAVTTLQSRIFVYGFHFWWELPQVTV